VLRVCLVLWLWFKKSYFIKVLYCFIKVLLVEIGLEKYIFG